MDYSLEVAKQADEHPQPGDTTGFTCPECGGAIWRSEHDNVVSFRCRVGHKYTAESFALEQGRTVEAAVWASLRLLEERIVLMRQLAERFIDHPRTRGNFERKAEELEQHAVALRSLIEGVAGAEALPLAASEQ